MTDDSTAGSVLRNAAKVASRKLTSRSKVTNGRALFAEGGDGRGLWGRRLRDLMELHINDLGGPGAVSEAEKSIVRRASVLEVELERLECQFSAKPADAAELDLYQRMTNTLRRQFEAVGLERRARDVTPSLQSYLAAKREPDDAN